MFPQDVALARRTHHVNASPRHFVELAQGRISQGAVLTFMSPVLCSSLFHDAFSAFYVGLLSAPTFSPICLFFSQPPVLVLSEHNSEQVHLRCCALATLAGFVMNLLLSSWRSCSTWSNAAPLLRFSSYPRPRLLFLGFSTHRLKGSRGHGTVGIRSGLRGLALESRQRVKAHTVLVRAVSPEDATRQACRWQAAENRKHRHQPGDTVCRSLVRPPGWEVRSTLCLSDECHEHARTWKSGSKTCKAGSEAAATTSY